MAKSNRTNADHLEWLQSLEAEPFRFGFNATLRQLEAIYATNPRLGEGVRAADDAIRLGQQPSLAFAPSELARFRQGGEGQPDRLGTFFFGVFGPNGPMPLHLSEYAHLREYNDEDPTFRRFVDAFLHRFASLFFRAWANSEPAPNMDRPDDNRFDLYVGALTGLGTRSLRNGDSIPDYAKFHRAALLAQTARPAHGLKALLRDFFGLPVSLREWVGEWLPIARQDQLRLGRGDGFGALGHDALLGGAVWSVQHRFRVVFGPLTLRQLEGFLPGSRGLKRLVDLVRNYLGDEFAWDVQLILKRDEVPALELGRQGRLGWTSWLGGKPRLRDADDVVLVPAEVHARV